MERASSSSSLLGLASDGGYLAANIATDAGSLLHPLFTLTAPASPPPKWGRLGGAAVLFCDPIPQITPPRGFLGIALYEVRTFLGSLSRDRPTSLRHRDNTLLPGKRQL